MKQVFFLKKIFFLLIFLLSIPLVLASIITVDKETYGLDEPVTISVTDCPGSSLLTVLNPYGQAVFSDQGNGDWQTVYHTSSDPTTGGYTINAFCGAESFSTTFDVGEVAPPTEEGRPSRRPCISDWSCGYWSLCGPDLTQTRTCVDLNNCLPVKTETRDCTPCVESWICSLWSNCIAGKQTRKCYDEHHCGTAVKKPVLQRSCDMPVTGPAPARTVPLPPEQFTIPPPEVEIPKPSFWEEYKTLIIAIPSILILLALAVFLFFRFYKKPKEEVPDIAELKDWVKKALAKGASKEKISEIIRQQGEWSDKELNQAFKELEQTPSK